MNDKDFEKMSMYKQTMGSVDAGKQKPVTFYDKYIKKEPQKAPGAEPKKEPKTAIWWMIMLFCLVYGFELVYNSMISMP